MLFCQSCYSNDNSDDFGIKPEIVTVFEGRIVGGEASRQLVWCKDERRKVGMEDASQLVWYGDGDDKNCKFSSVLLNVMYKL